MKSKIEIRLEAAKLAVKLPGTTIENFHDRAYRLDHHKHLKIFQIANPKKQRVAAKLPFYLLQKFST